MEATKIQKRGQYGSEKKLPLALAVMARMLKLTKLPKFDPSIHKQFHWSQFPANGAWKQKNETHYWFHRDDMYNACKEVYPDLAGWFPCAPRHHSALPTPSALDAATRGQLKTKIVERLTPSTSSSPDGSQGHISTPSSSSSLHQDEEWWNPSTSTGCENDFMDMDHADRTDDAEDAEHPDHPDHPDHPEHPEHPEGALGPDREEITENALEDAMEVIRTLPMPTWLYWCEEKKLQPSMYGGVCGLQGCIEKLDQLEVGDPFARDKCMYCNGDVVCKDLTVKMIDLDEFNV